jgi:hypothetical protein
MAPVSYDGTGVTVTLVSYDTPGCRMRRVVENVAATSGVGLIRSGAVGFQNTKKTTFAKKEIPFAIASALIEN